MSYIAYQNEKAKQEQAVAKEGLAKEFGDTHYKRPTRIVRQYATPSRYAIEMRQGVRQFVEYAREHLTEPSTGHFFMKQPKTLEHYINFCIDNGLREMNRVQLYAYLEDLGFQKKRKNSGDYLFRRWPKSDNTAA